MSDASPLDALRAAPAPRDAALCHALARRLEPTWGFIVYGILWIWLGASVAFVPAIGYVVVMGAHLSPQERAHSSILGTGMIGIWALGLGGVVWLFINWARRRRGRAAALFSDGRFVDATPGRPLHVWLRGAAITRIPLTFEADGTQATTSVAVPGHVTSLGSVIPILFKPGYRYCAAFPTGGGMIAVRWKG